MPVLKLPSPSVCAQRIVGPEQLEARTAFRRKHEDSFPAIAAERSRSLLGYADAFAVPGSSRSQDVGKFAMGVMIPRSPGLCHTMLEAAKARKQARERGPVEALPQRRAACSRGWRRFVSACKLA